jgi:hypothetical protein
MRVCKKIHNTHHQTGQHAKRATQHSPHLECEQQQEGLHRVEASVNKVTHEQVGGGRTVPTNLALVVGWLVVVVAPGAR